VYEVRLDAAGSDYGPMTYNREHSDEPSVAGLWNVNV
jgi:hypothetical protein